MPTVRSAVSSLTGELIPLLVLLTVSAASVAIFFVSSTYTLDRVAAAAQSGAVQTTLRTSYGTALRSAAAHELDVSRAVPVVVDMASKQPALQTISVVGSYTHSVAVESLRVRSEPKKSSPQVGALAGGDKVTVTEERAGWMRVTAGNGVQGWVYHQFLTSAAADTASAE